MGTSIFDRRERTGHFWRDHSLSLVILGVWAVGSVLSFFVAYYGSFAPDARSHGESVPGLWSAEYQGWFWTEWLMGVAHEPYGVLLPVLLTVWFVERGSAESKE